MSKQHKSDNQALRYQRQAGSACSQSAKVVNTENCYQERFM